MVRAVLDTNVFLRALINPKGPSARLLDLSARFEAVLSPEIIKELLEVLHRPSIRKKYGLTDALVGKLLEVLADLVVVEPVSHLAICRDPADNKFLECAVEGRADYLVTQDHDLLSLNQYQGVKIVDVRTFLQVLQ